jgi:hypothetical protein
MKSWLLLTASSLSLLLIFLGVIGLMIVGYVGPGPASAAAFVCMAGMLILNHAVRCDECQKSAFRRDVLTPGTVLGETVSYMSFWPERRCSRCGAATFEAQQLFGRK